MKKTFRYRINQNILAQTLRIIDDKGKNLGIMDKGEALRKAGEKGLDLVEVASKANPPVAKILDFRKYLTEERKEERRKRVGLKEIRVRPNIGSFDLGVRIERIKSFLGGRNSVKITCRFRGREKEHPEVGKEKLLKILEAVKEKGKQEGEIGQRGNFMEVMIRPR